MNNASPNEGFFQARRTRIGLVVATALYLFLVCAAYLSRTPSTPSESIAVFGPSIVRATNEIPLRIIGFEHASRSHSSVTALGATARTSTGETVLTLKPGTRGTPSYLHLSGTPSQTGAFDLILDLQSSANTSRKVVAPMTTYDAPMTVWPTAMRLPDKVPAQALQIDVLTEGPGLALQLLNTVWIRVTDTSGLPVSGAMVSWGAVGAMPSKGIGESDAAGLVAIQVTPNNLSTRFTVDAEKGELSGHQEQTEQPLGRAAVIRTSRIIQAGEEPPISLAIVQPEDGGIFCDLVKDDSWIRTWHLETRNGEPPIVQVDLPETGVYQFQCYSHFAKPGDGADSLYLFRTSKSRLSLTKELLRAEASGRTGTYRNNSPVVGSAAMNALLASFRTKAVGVVPPALLANTRKADVQTARVSNDRTRARFMLLIGASFGMVILWAVYVGIQSAIESRVRLAAAIAELGDMAVDVGPLTGLTRARMVVQVLLVLLALALNVLGMLALYQYM